MCQHMLLATELTDENAVIEGRTAAIQKLTDAKLSIIHVIEPLPPMYSSCDVLAVRI